MIRLHVFSEIPRDELDGEEYREGEKKKGGGSVSYLLVHVGTEYR